MLDFKNYYPTFVWFGGYVLFNQILSVFFNHQNLPEMEHHLYISHTIDTLINLAHSI